MNIKVQRGTLMHYHFASLNSVRVKNIHLKTLKGTINKNQHTNNLLFEILMFIEFI